MPVLRHHSARHRALLLLLGAVLVLPGLAATPLPAAQAATDPCAPGGTPIACENSKAGTDPAEWDTHWGDAGNEEIQGFATDISVNAGSAISFKVDTEEPEYTISVYRIGYYGGKGARFITTVPVSSPEQDQPDCITDEQTELYDCGNWEVSATWQVPPTAVSGVYIAKLEVPSTQDRSHITFVVRDDASHSDIVFQTSDPTWQAYNTYGGADFYQGAANGRAYKLSYNRPLATRNGPGGRDFFFSNEYPLVRFLERNGYDVSYLAGVDTDRRGQLLKNHQVFLSVGHDEYWSKAQREHVESARDAGVNLQFLSGNEVYWKTRYEPSADAGHTPYRTLVSYKETWSNAKIDPDAEWTGTWRDPRFAARSKGGGRPENGLTGTAYMSNYSDLALTVSAAEGKRRLWRGTPLATMTSGTATLAPHTIGYESNEDLLNSARPPGLIRLSTTAGPVPEYLQDFGNSVASGSTTHHLTLYRAASGALVFSAGSVQWTWGLDGEHDSPFAPEPADPRMQQAQVNLLADMGAQPATLVSGLVRATKSSDTTGPTVAITSPAAGATFANGTQVSIAGTAADVGGVVAGVEVSTDGGTTWRPATGTTSWSHRYLQHGQGSVPVLVRAIDDSANIGTTASRSLQITCPCSVFGNTTPAVPAANDGYGAELGLRFTPTADGFVSGIRFYKGEGNTGSHTGTLWSAAGARLADVAFGPESATGWQSATFAAAVPVAAGETYVASYTAPNGRYAVQPYAFASDPVDSPPLFVEGGFGAPAAGVFGSPGTFPSQSYQNASYFVDVTYTATDDSPLTAISQWPQSGATSVSRTTTVSARLSKPVLAASVALSLVDDTGAAVPGATAYDAATRTVTFTPSAPLAGFVGFTATVSATESSGGTVTSGRTWAFRTAKPPATPGVCPCTLFDEDTVPVVAEDPERAELTLGVRFSPTTSGTITGLRFYKVAANAAPHLGTLWSAGGAVLAQGTFSAESTSGWQTLTFAQPVPVQANATYVASYRTQGVYSATPNAFAAADLSRGPLRVTSAAGAYAYGSGFPSGSSPTSYLVDVVFEKAPPTIAVTAQVPRGTRLSVSFSAPVAEGFAMTARHGTTPVPGTAALSADATTLTFTPASRLPADAEITVSLSGVVSTDAAPLPTQTWTFRTRAAESVSAQTLFGDLVPDRPAESDSSAVEVGTVFRADRAGSITALRFFKGPGNGGTHTATLWTADGERLSSVTFTAESGSGWQQAALATPVAVAAGTTYVVSYHAPQGHYSATPGLFAGPWSAGDLTALAGRFAYGPQGEFPVHEWGRTNYFADVLFQRAPASIGVLDRAPAPGATDVVRSATPSITLSAPVAAAGWSMVVTQAGTPLAGTAALSADRTRLVFTPDAPLPADADLTATVHGVVSVDGAGLPTQTWSFRTRAGAAGTHSLFEDVTPAIAAEADDGPVELGLAFRTAAAGEVTAIRFFKGPGNAGTHTGTLWTSSGDVLSTVTFTDETAGGWQVATLPEPVPLEVGETYLVSYFAPQGRYSATGSALTEDWTVGPLTAPGGWNGRYRYGPGGGFPTGSWGSANYFVDVVFRQTP